MILTLHLTKLILSIFLILVISIFYGRKPKRNEIAPAIILSLFFTILMPTILVTWSEGNGDPLFLFQLPLLLLITLRFPDSNIGKGLGVIFVVLFIVLHIEHMVIASKKEYTDDIKLIQRYRATAARSEAKRAGSSKEECDKIAKKASEDAEKSIHHLWHTWLTGLYWVEPRK
jgi:cell division protein FtsW (lipid II flippase)